MTTDAVTPVREIQTIGAVPQVLETVASLTGLGFVAIAHVTDHSWTTCAVHDRLGFGLKVGDGLDVSTTLCEQVCSTRNTIVIDHVRENEQYRNHHTPRIYGFQSYFSVPVFRRDGSFFGTLCGLDPEPRILSAPSTVSTLELFAQLLSAQLESERVHAAAQAALLSERETAELREQFSAVLGHDLRTPLSSLQSGAEALLNLVKNAVVYGASGSPIHVLATCANDRFFMSVTNEGPALPPQVASQLFKPFWRAPASGPHEGLGLGLYIVSEIARSHQGTVDVASLDGKVCFTFAMPVAAR